MPADFRLLPRPPPAFYSPRNLPDWSRAKLNSFRRKRGEIAAGDCLPLETSLGYRVSTSFPKRRKYDADALLFCVLSLWLLTAAALTAAEPS